MIVVSFRHIAMKRYRDHELLAIRQLECLA